MTRVYLSLGTNMGDRKSNINTAVRLLEDALGKDPAAVSAMIESKSWGFEGGDFINCVLSFDTTLDPRGLLKVCKDIERRMGRRERIEYNGEGNRIYHDRIIDIDILLYGNLCINEPDLVIPHPLMKERDFIMRPLMEIFVENH